MSELWDDNDNDINESEGNGNEQELIDVSQITERIEDLPLSEYFIETRKNAKRRSAVSWLESCDSDTVSLICSYAKKVREKESGDTKDSVAIENKTADIFDLQLEENSNLTVTDEEDFYSLVLLILAWENNTIYINENNVGEAAFTLGMYAAIDVLKRNGIVKAKGSGTLLSKKTEYVLTSRCKKMTKKELTAALKSIDEITNKK